MAKEKSKWANGYKSLEGFVDPNEDAYAPENCMYTPSPSINSIFANKSHGIPKGTSILLYGEEKTGKTFLINSILEKMCMDDPNAHAIFFNTEMRTRFQSGQSEGSSLFRGIDRERVFYFDTNQPAQIFDLLERQVKDDVNAGMQLRYVIIDSLSDVAGTQALDPERSVDDQLMGDQARTIQRGLDKIKYLKSKNIILISTAHIVANIGGPYDPKTKPKTTSAIRHFYEYFIGMRKANSKDDKTNIAGETFTDSSRKDARGEEEITGHKVIVKMEKSSLGAAGRSGIITLNFNKGIINVEEEIFELCKNAGIIENVGAGGYVVYGEKIRGKAEVARRIKDNAELQQKLLTDLKALDSRSVANVG